MTTLESLRAEIDRTDAEIYALFARRMALARQIGREKKALGKAICDPGRERIVRERARARAGEELEPYAEELCDTLTRLSRAYQEDTFSE